MLAAIRRLKVQSVILQTDVQRAGGRNDAQRVNRRIDVQGADCRTEQAVGANEIQYT